MTDLLKPLAEQVGARLMARGETIAVAESACGGLISAALLAIPGASAYFRGGGVIYTTFARGFLLGIGDDEMVGLRASTEGYARLLAIRARDGMRASWGLAETGAAGPSGNRYGDAAGHCCFAVHGPVDLAETLETGSADRAANMDRFAVAALTLLESALR
jgi:nicotinamide-nucleotide amidase